LGKAHWDELPDHIAAYMVDSIVALVLALSSLSPALRTDGAIVASRIRSQSFEGVSGAVAFTPEGDRRDPLFTILNAQRRSDGTLHWQDVGTTTATGGNETVLFQDGLSGICFAKVGCNQTVPPDDSYPVPPLIWVAVVLPIVAALLLFLAYRYWRSHRKKGKYITENNSLKTSLSQMQKKIDEMNKIDDELADVTDQVEAAKKKQASLIAARAKLQDTPETWSTTDKTLVSLPPEDGQYWDVAEKLRETMDDAHISELWRVQNESLWTYYSFHKHRLSMHSIDHNERSVWHGTSSLDPSVIYNDKQDGFMMQFSRVGFWGRGIYFADKSEYSHFYAFSPASLGSWFSSGGDRPKGKDDEREMFLAKLLVGNSVLMDRDESPFKAAVCENLTVPPDDPKKKLKYNTVTGYTCGSQVWIVYENDRAYPDSLVRYYRGDRDPKRSPYETRSEATKDAASTLAQPPPSKSDNDDFTWEFQGDDGWVAYSDANQAILKASYKRYKGGKGGKWASNKHKTVRIKSGDWTYEVDLANMTQTNIQHQGRRQRAVRRWVAVWL